MNVLFKILAVVFCLFSTHIKSNLVYVDFDESMQTKKYAKILQSHTTEKEVGISSFVLLRFFRELYEKNSFLKLVPSSLPKIPKIIHQIWIGDKVPEKFMVFQKEWIKKHPDWEYMFWTQDDIADFGFYNYELIKESRNPGEISDIMRYEILNKYGGVYIDFDFECLQPLDELNCLYDLYVGVQPLDCGFLQLGIGLIGSIPGHPILQHAIKNMKKSWNLPENKKNPPKRTGPIYFTRSFYSQAGVCGTIDVALPVHYLYPLGCKEFDLYYDMWEKQGVFGVHHWASSWLLPKFRRKQFRNLS
ncbi:hypothetical protein KAH94_04735 [bacterium]|nr:hypothetical protein [bacterium]